MEDALISGNTDLAKQIYAYVSNLFLFTNNFYLFIDVSTVLISVTPSHLIRKFLKGFGCVQI